jgi:hypothetical protein
METYEFHPPLRVRGHNDLVIRTLEDAERFVHEEGARRGHNSQGLLRRLQSAWSSEELEDAARAFQAWLEAEGLLLFEHETP